jgi:DNA polymerase-4
MERSNNFGRTVTLKLKTPDFRLFTRSKTFEQELRDRDVLKMAIQELLDAHVENIPAVRLLGVTISNLTVKDEPREGIQLELDLR